MSWRNDSSAGAFIWDSEPMTKDDLALRDEEILWLMAQGRKDWKLINGRISRSGDPQMMAEGTYGALGAYPLSGALSGVTLSATESAGITNAQQPIYVPMLGNATLAPQAWRFSISARYTVTTTPGSIVTSFRLGNANTSPLLGTQTGGTALTASLTNAFILWKGDITIYSVGPPGANSKATGIFTEFVNTAVGGAFNSALWGTGSTAASYDSTLTSLGTNGGALWLGLSDSGATNHATVTIDQIHWMDWN